MLTTSDDQDTLFAALRAGARGYLLKAAGKDTIVAVAAGQAVFGPQTADAVVASFRRATSKPDAFSQLSRREREMLDLIAAGLSNMAVARRLMLSEKTFRNNISMILAKIQADRAQAIVIARQGRPGPATPIAVGQGPRTGTGTGTQINSICTPQTSNALQNRSRTLSICASGAGY